MNALNNEAITSHTHDDDEKHTIAVFDNGDSFRVVHMNPANGAMVFIVEDGCVTGPEKKFVVTINFDFYGTPENGAEVTGAASEYASINYLDSHYFNQYVADRKANLITACALHEARYHV